MPSKLMKAAKELVAKTDMSYQDALLYVKKRRHSKKPYLIIDELKGLNIFDDIKDEDGNK